MKLKKEDYMHLPKERLAELLVEMDNHTIEPIQIPAIPNTRLAGMCDGTYCTNPQMDCINCPRRTTGGGTTTSPNTFMDVLTMKENE